MKFTHPGQSSKISFLSHYSHSNWVSLLKQLDLDVVFITNARLARRTGVLFKRFIGERKAWSSRCYETGRARSMQKSRLVPACSPITSTPPPKYTVFFCTRVLDTGKTELFWLLLTVLIEKKKKKNRIYSINRPGRLLNFCTLRVGAYKIFTLFNKCSMYILQQNSKWQ